MSERVTNSYLLSAALLAGLGVGCSSPSHAEGSAVEKRPAAAEASAKRKQQWKLPSGPRRVSVAARLDDDAGWTLTPALSQREREAEKKIRRLRRRANAFRPRLRKLPLELPRLRPPGPRPSCGSALNNGSTSLGPSSG